MRNVIVTGGSRGLGLAIGRTLALSGYRVIAIARKPSEAWAAAIAEVSQTAPEALVLRPYDLTDIEGIPALARGIRREFGPIYGLVNNAGLGTEGLLATMPNAEIERLIRLNTLSPAILTKYVVRAMMADGAGRVVNVSSVIGFTGYSGLSVYAATKAAMIGFTRSLAREVGRLGITVNAVAPGFIETEMTQGLSADDRGRVARRSALQRLAEPADVAGAVEYLLSDKARNITGTVLTVDAGSTA